MKVWETFILVQEKYFRCCGPGVSDPAADFQFRNGSAWMGKTIYFNTTKKTMVCDSVSRGDLIGQQILNFGLR